MKPSSSCFSANFDAKLFFHPLTRHLCCDGEVLAGDSVGFGFTNSSPVSIKSAGLTSGVQQRTTFWLNCLAETVQLLQLRSCLPLMCLPVLVVRESGFVLIQCYFNPGVPRVGQEAVVTDIVEVSSPCYAYIEEHNAHTVNI